MELGPLQKKLIDRAAAKENSMIKSGENVYYIDADGSWWPGVVKQVGHSRVQVAINHENGDKTVWVKPSNLEPQP